MSKRGPVMKKSKGKKNAALKTPHTVDEYQAAGVELEEAGEKWRAGDASKSLRFFNRAIDMYGQGLQKFPNSLDLAYNKARAQFEIVTHPVLSEELGVDAERDAFLQETLASHRYALSLDANNADTLFNMAQVLTSIAEDMYSKHEVHGRAENVAIRYLEEALELFQRCYSVQELAYTEFEDQKVAALSNQEAEDQEAESMVIDPPDEISSTSESEQWASIIEPVTKDTLLDTLLAQLSSLTALCGVLGLGSGFFKSPKLGWIEQYSSVLIHSRLPSLLTGSKRKQEAEIAKAVFYSGMVETRFRVKLINQRTFKQERDAVFANLPGSQGVDPDATMANVASLIAFNTAEYDLIHDPIGHKKTDVSEPDILALRWTALAEAVSLLAEASKLPPAEFPSPDFLPQTHFLRGDTSLRQVQMRKGPDSYEPAIRNVALLLGNAAVFYRNASRLWQQNQEEADRSNLREGMAMLLLGKTVTGNGKEAQNKLDEIEKRRGQSWTSEQVHEMVREGLLRESDLSE